ncbi:hypothetical protein cypCar_00034780 [Cyprinus carpio]|nr:hypothetical protein cypCar_00034780 [Cyprinus carpio]
MTMDWHRDGLRTFEEESSYMERTFLKLAHSSKPKLGGGGGGLSITQQKATQTSSSLDESSPVESKRHQPPLLSSECQKKLPKDEGYMPMIYSIAPSPNADYIPMQPRANHPATLDIHPCSSQQADRYSYMMMLPGDSPSSREQAEYDDYMDMSQLTVAEGFSQASPDGPKTSYFSLPRSYKAPSREKHEKMEYIPMSPAEPPSPPSPGEYIHMDFGSRSSHTAASPPSVNSPSTPPPSQPCYRHCCSSPDHDYLGLNMDGLLKDRPPRHSLVAPWNPPNYARPLGCTYGQTSTNLEMHDECGDGPLRAMQHLCISERLPFSHTEPKVIRADPQGRRRHSSETFIPLPASFASGCGIRPSANQNLPEASRWQNSSSFDSMRSHSGASPNSTALATSSASRGMPQNTSSSYLNYIALDLREVPRVTRDTPPPHPAHSNLQESDAYAGIDFSVSGGRATASKVIKSSRPVFWVHENIPYERASEKRGNIGRIQKRGTLQNEYESTF